VDETHVQSHVEYRKNSSLQVHDHVVAEIEKLEKLLAGLKASAHELLHRECLEIDTQGKDLLTVVASLAVVREATTTLTHTLLDHPLSGLAPKNGQPPVDTSDGAT
jgi:hypothetical protein